MNIPVVDHGRGIGRRLVDSAGAPFDELEVEVFKDSVLGRRFYTAYGFVTVDEAVHEPTGRVMPRLRNPADGPIDLD